jgi:hypothetical protein
VIVLSTATSSDQASLSKGGRFLLFAFFALWVLHVLAALFLALPIIAYGKGRVRWDRWELLAFVLPFAIWACLITTNSRPKSLANLSEVILLAPAIAITALVRVLIGSREPQALWPRLMLGLLCVAALGVYNLVPMLAE